MTEGKREKFNHALTKLNRHQLGTIDLSSCKDIDILEGSERQSYLERAEAAYNNSALKSEITFLIQKQLEFIACESESEEQKYVGRGTINGLSLVLERLEQLHSMHQGERSERLENLDEEDEVEE